MGGADPRGPGLDARSVDLHGRAARPADQVVVVLATLAPTVEGLALAGSDHIDLVRLGERLQRAVDRGEPDRVPVRPKVLMQLLSAAEVVERDQRLGHRGALTGHALDHRCASWSSGAASPRSRASSTSSSISGCGSCHGRRATSGRATAIARTTMVAPGE